MKHFKEFEPGYDFTAKTFAGLEEVLAAELKSLGAKDIETTRRAVYFRGDQKLMYRCNYECRTALRILKPIGIFTVNNENELYDKLKKIDWTLHFNEKKSILIKTNLFHSNITHSHFASLKAKDAIVDFFREKRRKRPDVAKDDPDIVIDLHINKNRCTVSLDGSGHTLNKRRYRVASDKAPINEVLAAGMIQLTEWDKTGDFIDPMCGSGTIAIEAAMYAMNIPAGYYRNDYSFMHWNDFDEKLWKEIKSGADAKITEHDFPVIASDKSFRAFGIARTNIKFAGLHKDITLLNKPFDKINPETGSGILVFNPPYGERLKDKEITELYKMIGDVLKNKFPGYKAWIITANPQAAKSIGLHASKKIILYNGQLESRFLKFDIYSGSKKKKKTNH
jgi:putative N6-adenine-specific DNA methylase